MSWLRLPHLQADEPQIVRSDDGEIAEVLITCRTKGAHEIPEVCCTAPRWLKNGTKTIRVRDRRLEPAPTWLLIQRQRFKCTTCNRTLYERLPDVDDDHYVTRRLREDIARSAIKRPFEDAATFHSVEATLVRRIFMAYAAEKLTGYEYEPPRVFGVDENRILGGDRFVCADIEQGKILDMLPRRDGATLDAYFDRLPGKGGVEVFCQDMWRGYETVARNHFPRALVVIDKFHVVRYANDAMDNARKSFQAKMSNEERRAMKRLNRMFLGRWERMSEERQDRLASVLADFPLMSMAYAWKERFYDLYELENRTVAEQAFFRWTTDMPAEVQPFFRPIVRMVKAWGRPIFNYYEARYTNGMVENLNGRINEINRRGFGYEFDTLRAKALLRYGRLVPFGSLAQFRFPVDLTPEEVDAIVNAPIGKGVTASTLARALRDGRF